MIFLRKVCEMINNFDYWFGRIVPGNAKRIPPH